MLLLLPNAKRQTLKRFAAGWNRRFRLAAKRGDRDASFDGTFGKPNVL